MKRLNTKVRQRKRQTWLAMPASGIEVSYGDGAKARSATTAARRKTRGEEEIRLHCMAGTRQALAELMQWNGIEEQGEAITLMIHHLHGLGPGGSAQYLEAPRHTYVIPENVSAKLTLAYQRESLRICRE